MDDVSCLTTLQLTDQQHSKVVEATGRCVLAQFTDREVVVYQAYTPAIGVFAAEHNYFGGNFNFERMSWVKPSFTWMAHRCDWATKPFQEVGERLDRHCLL